jgi:CHAD domain-containing protein
MEQALTQAADERRDTVHQALCDPQVGVALLAVTRWLEIDLAQWAADSATDSKTELQDWARQQTRRWHDQLKKALTQAHDTEGKHRARLLAKRLRYGIEALRPLLPKRRAKHWHLQASRLQDDMGSARDVQQAWAIATRLKLTPSLLDFLRGVAVGKASAPQ